MNSKLNKNQIERFSRQIILKNIGALGQKLYKNLVLCYTNLILGRSQAVRHGFLVPAS